MPPVGDTHDRPRSPWLWPVAWAAAAAAALATIATAYRNILHVRLGPDFAVYYGAAAKITHGASPYDVAKFVYTPVVAILIRPLVTTDIHHAFRIWTIANLVFIGIAIVAFLASQPATDSRWHGPALLVICGVTAAYFWPLKVAILLGQTDPLVTMVLMGAMWAGTRGYSGTRGALVSAAGLVKVWPWALVAVVVQTGLRARTRFLIGFGLVVLLAPLTALLWGGHGLWGLWHNAFEARSQHQVSRSLWGTADLLFTRTGFAHPLAVSGGLRVGFDVLALAWVVALAVIALRTPGDAGLCLWTLMGCLVLLLPVCHTAYSLYLLPLVWIWIARALRGGPTRTLAVAAAAVMVGWWLIMTHAWPDNGSSPSLSALRYSVDFGADLVALSVSTGCAYLAQTARRQPTRQSPGRPPGPRRGQ
jgi:hypothetical protein